MRRALLAYAAVCTALAVAVYVVAFDTFRGRSWDAYTLAAAVAQRDAPTVQEASVRLINTIDIGSLVLLGGGILGVAIFLRNTRGALAAVIVIAGANATTQILKPLLGRLEPFGDRPELADSFPSGHATVAMSLALAAVLVAPPAWKLLVALGGAAYAAALGISLLVQAGHYPSDVAGAFLIVGAWAGAVAAALAGGFPPPTPDAKRAGLITAGAAAAAFALAVLIAVETHPGIVVRVQIQAKLVLVSTLLVALALGVACVLAFLLQAMALRSASTTRSCSSRSIVE